MIESTVRQYLSEALRRHHAGELREAEVLYRQVLSYQPAWLWMPWTQTTAPRAGLSGS